MNAGLGLREATGEVSVGLADWMHRLDDLLADVQRVLEGAQLEEVEPNVRSVAAHLVPRLRDCRAGVPNDDVIALWVREVTARRASKDLAPTHR